MKILLVDDHILFREGLMSLLSAQPEFTVVGEAGSASQAIEQARLLRPDLVLMDFSLPDATGLEATRAILAENPACKIVFLTIHDTDDRLFAAIRLGAKGYLLKNVPIAKLLASLKALERGEPAVSRSMAGRILDEFSRIEYPQPRKTDVLARLSQREFDVLQELAGGASNRQIAQRLFISENTVKHHLHSLLSKLELNDRSEAAHFARMHDLKPNPIDSKNDITGKG